MVSGQLFPTECPGLCPSGHGDSASRPSRGRRSTSRTTRPRTASSSPSRDEHNGPTFIVRRARLPYATLLSLLAFLAYRSSHHILPLPAAPSLDAGTAPPPWHAHHVAPPHVRHQARAARHSSLSSSCSLRPDASSCSVHAFPRLPWPLPASPTCSPDMCPCFSDGDARVSPSATHPTLSPSGPRVSSHFDCSHRQHQHRGTSISVTISIHISISTSISISILSISLSLGTSTSTSGMGWDGMGWEAASADCSVLLSLCLCLLLSMFHYSFLCKQVWDSAHPCWDAHTGVCVYIKSSSTMSNKARKLNLRHILHISNNVSIKLTSGPKRRINKVRGLHHAGTRVTAIDAALAHVTQLRNA